MSVKDQRAFRDIPYIPNDDTNARIINDLIDHFNFLSKNLSLRSNFNGQVLENVVFSPGEEKVIPHKLGIKPKHRIILNQVGNGVLSDVPSGWNQYQIQIKNNGAVNVVATVMLVKE